MNNKSDLEQQFLFLKEIDKLKSIIRKSPLINESRKENSAEHSWHLAMYALILSDYSNEDIDVNRVIKMLLIHDIVEIDAGDFPIHEVNNSSNQEKMELDALERIFNLLPINQSTELKKIWKEFEDGKSSDAIFAKSLDRLQPLIHNVNTNGGTWIEAKVTNKQVDDRYGIVISKGAKTLWNFVSVLVKKHFTKK